VEIRSNEKLFVETNGYISIYAQHFSANIKKPGTEWKPTKGLGTVGASLTSVLLTLPKAVGTDTALIKKSAAYAAYRFVSYSNKPPVVTVYTLPTHPLNKNFSVRYGVSIDDGPVEIVDVKTVGRSEEWKQNVLRNSTVKAIPIPALKPGKHVLKLYVVDPGVVLDRVLINFGEGKKSYSAVPETMRF
jgi:hypothetical protein